MKEVIKNNLNYMETVLSDGSFRQYKPIFIVVVNETIAMVNETTFSYEIKLSATTENRSHFPAYYNKGFQYKAKLIADLEDILVEVLKDDSRSKDVALVKVRKIIASDLYQKDVQNFLDKHEVLRGKVATENIHLK